MNGRLAGDPVTRTAGQGVSTIVGGAVVTLAVIIANGDRDHRADEAGVRAAFATNPATLLAPASGDPDGQQQPDQ